MNNWEIKEVENMSEDEQREYLAKLAYTYEKQIKQLKAERGEKNLELLKFWSWRSVLIAGAIGIFAGSSMMALGNPAVHQAGIGVGAASVVGIVGSIMASLDIDDIDISEVKKEFKASTHAKKEIANLKKEIKKIEKNPIMPKR